MSEIFTHASQATAYSSEDAINISGDDLLSLLETLRRDGFPIGVKEYIAAQEILIACCHQEDLEPTRLRNWLAPVLCTNSDEQRFFYQRFAEWLQQLLPPQPIHKNIPQPHKTQLDKDVKKARPWKWLIIAAALMAALVLAPLLPVKKETSQTNSATEPGLDQATPTQPKSPVKPEPVKQKTHGPQLIIDGRVNDLEGGEISGATVTVIKNLKGHQYTVSSIAFNPAGSKVVTASGDNTARLWSIKNGQEQAHLKHGDSVNSAQFNADGSLVITASSDNTARIWNAKTGEEVKRLLHGDWVNSAVFSQNGSRVITASNDNTARIWNVNDGQEVASLSHDYKVYYAEFSPDGRYVVTASGDGTARIWEVPSGREFAKLFHDGPVTSASYSADGKYIVTASADETARVWDAGNAQELAVLEHTGAVNSARFSPDGLLVVTASADKTARVWENTKGQELARLHHSAWVNSARFSSDGQRVVTASWDKTARIWNAHDGVELSRLLHDRTVYSATFSPDEKLLATSGGNSAKGVSWPVLLQLTNSDTSGNFTLSTQITGETQLSISHPDYQLAPLLNLPKQYGKLTVNSLNAPRLAQWLDTFIQNPQLTRIILALLPLLAVSTWWLWRRKRRQLILERRSVRNVDALAGITIPEPPHKLYRDEFFVRARIEARRHQASGQGDLDADATVDETIRKQGWFSPVYKTRLRLPAYLALIDRNGFRDQQSRMIDEFLDRLENGGVEVDRYYFDRDPRICVSGVRGNKTRRTLRELAGRYAAHRLLMFSDGSGLLNPITARPSPWTEQFSAWSERALMTPVPAFHWASREVELARLGLRVLPATPAGLLAFVEQLSESKNSSPISSAQLTAQLPNQMTAQWCEQFPEIITAHPARWLQADEPQADDIELLLTQLKHYLGADSYRWLCALSVYPELDWYLTLYLGLHLKTKDDKSLLDETALLRLLRLPWLRRGYIPDWLRLHLIKELNRNDEETIRGFLRELMRDQLEAPDSRFHLDIAQPSGGIHKRDWTRFFTDMLRTEPEDSPLQDLVFVNFLLGKRPQSLQVLAPSSWRRLVYEQGLSALGFRERAGFLLAMGMSALLVLGTLPLIQFAESFQNSDTPSQIIEQDWQPAKSPSQEISQANSQAPAESVEKFEPATKIADPSAFPPDHTAVYSMTKNAMTIGEHKVSLRRQKDGSWLYQSQSKPEGFLSFFIKTAAKAETTLEKIQGQIKPQSYKYTNRETKQNTLLNFSWNINWADYLVNETAGSLKITDETIDNLSLYLRLMSDLKTGQTFLSYNVFEKGKIVNYRFEILGEDTIETDAGQYNTLKLRGRRNESEQSMMIWFAPELHYLPVKISSADQSEDVFDNVLSNSDISLTRVTGSITGKPAKPVAQQTTKEMKLAKPAYKLKDVFTEKDRFSVRKLNLNKNGRFLEMHKGGQINATLQINHNCPKCGGAINQIIVGLAGEERAQACIWNGGQTSRGWQTVKFKLDIPDAPGDYEIRTRYAQAYNCNDALGWWKVDRPTGPGIKSTIGVVSVKKGDAKPVKPDEADTQSTDQAQQNTTPQPTDWMNAQNISTLNKKWNTKVWAFYNKNIKGRYPFNRRSTRNVSLEDFTKFFGPDGIMQQFTENELAPYIDTTRKTWRWKNNDPLNNPGFTKEALRQLQQAASFRLSFFINGLTPTARIQLKPLRLDKSVRRFILEFDNQRLTYSHGPKFWKKIQWLGTRNKHRVRYIFEDLNGKTTQVEKTGPWAWLKILDQADIKKTQQSYIKILTLTADVFSVSYKYKEESYAHSTRPSFRQFKLPESLINPNTNSEQSRPKPPTSINVR